MRLLIPYPIFVLPHFCSCDSDMHACYSVQLKKNKNNNNKKIFTNCELSPHFKITVSHHWFLSCIPYPALFPFINDKAIKEVNTICFRFNLEK